MKNRFAVKPIPEILLERMREIMRDFEHLGKDPCWEWTRSRNPSTGYGQMNCRCEGKSTLFTAHRVALSTVEKCSGQNVYALHKCDNRICINPSHLYWGTIKNNANDMVQRGRRDFKATALRGEKHWSKRLKDRMPKGIKNNMAKLTDEIVLHIRQSSELGSVLAEKFNVSSAAISSVRLFKTWKHVQPNLPAKSEANG